MSMAPKLRNINVTNRFIMSHKINKSGTRQSLTASPSQVVVNSNTPGEVLPILPIYRLTQEEYPTTMNTQDFSPLVTAHC